MFAQPTQMIAQSSDFLGQHLQRSLFVKHVQRSQSRSRSERVSTKRMAVVKRAAFVKLSQKRAINAFVRDGGRNRQITARKPFPQAQKIGHHAFLLAREHCAEPAEPYGH